MKKLGLLFILIFAGCAHSAPKNAETAKSATPAPSPTPEIPEFAKFREQGFELLYQKDQNKRDLKKAFELFQKAAEFNDPISMDVLGGFYTSGLGGTERSCKKAIEMYSKAALLGYPLSVNNLAYSLVTCPDQKLRNPERAKKLVQNLFQQTPFFLAVLDTYAAALAEAKEKNKAVAVQNTVIEIGRLMEIEPSRMKQLEQSLAAYKKGKSAPATFDADPDIFPKSENDK